MPPTQVVPVIDALAQFPPGPMHEWRLVLVGLGWMRAAMIVLLPVACLVNVVASITDTRIQP